MILQVTYLLDLNLLVTFPPHPALLEMDADDTDVLLALAAEPPAALIPWLSILLHLTLAYIQAPLSLHRLLRYHILLLLRHVLNNRYETTPEMMNLQLDKI
jgi:hypothetical protein